MSSTRVASLALALLLTSCSASSADAATVLSIGDGDTLTLFDQGQKVKVRLACIDAPESSQRPAGPAARVALQQRLPIGTAVQLQAKTIDRYGRTVAEVFSNGRNINQSLVGSGAAFVYWDYIAGCDRNTYARLEQQAKAQRLGVWGPQLGYDLMLPWDYRRCMRSGGC